MSVRIIFKFLILKKKSYVKKARLKFKMNYDDHQNEWKEIFIYFCVMPFTDYEFQDADGRLLSADTLHTIGPSQTNLLSGTFSKLNLNHSTKKFRRYIDI
jgi:hypothetical protein